MTTGVPGRDMTYWEEIKLPLKRIVTKVLWLLQSRKFMGLVAGVLVIFNVVPTEAETEIVEYYFVAIKAGAALLAAMGFAVTTAWEDAARS